MSAGGVPSARVRVALLLSGAAGLIQEVVWTRLWAQVTGSGAAAAATVLAVFMAGLGTGAWGYRRLARRLAAGSGVGLYRRVEWGLAAAAVAAPAAMALADAAFVRVVRAQGLGWGGLPAVRLALAAALFGPLAVAMGATVPAMVAACSRPGDPPDRADRCAATIYRWNTAGGVVGTLAAGFVLLPVLGIRRTLWVAALCSLVAAYLVADLEDPPVAPGAPASGEVPEAAGDPASGSAAAPGAGGWAMAVYGFVGFWSLALEVLYTRVLSASLGATTYAFSVVLAAFLAGIAAGSAPDPSAAAAPARALARRLAALALAVAGTAAALPYAGQIYLVVVDLRPGWAAATAGAAVLGGGFLFPVGWCLGRVFPAAAGCLRVGRSPADAVAAAYFVNSLGAALGAFAAYRWIAPRTGVLGAVAAAAVSLYAAALLVAARAGRVPWGRAAVGGAVIAAAFWAAGTLWIDRAAWRYRGVDRGRSGPGGLAEIPQKLRWYRDGPDASVALVDMPDGNRSLIINGKSDADLVNDMQAQRLLGMLPMLLGPDGAEVLMFGLGAGGSADSALYHPLRSLDVAELCPTVAAASRAGFRHAFPRAYDDPRMRLHIADGRLLVRGWPRRVDVISSEPTNLYVRGVANLYTREFFAACRARLKPGGLLVQWVQSYDLDRPVLRAMVRTLGRAFPHVALAWFNDLFFLASTEPIRFDFERIRRRLRRPGVERALAQAGLPAVPEAIVGRFLVGRDALMEWAGEGPELTDDHSDLEYRAARLRFADTSRDLAEMLVGLRSMPGFRRELPLDGLVVPAATGGRDYPVARLWLSDSLAGGRAYVLRLAEAGLGVLGFDAPKVAAYELRDARGFARVQSYPASYLPDPAAPVSALVTQATAAGAGVVESGRVEVHGHGGRWLRLGEGPGFEGRGVAAWVCPEGGSTYLVHTRAAGTDRRGDRRLLAEVVAGLGCLHGSAESGWRPGRGVLLAAARASGEPAGR